VRRIVLTCSNCHNVDRLRVVVRGVTGFVFEPYHPEPLLGAVLRGLDCFVNATEWARMRRSAMGRDFSWERSVERYLDVYARVLANAAAPG
jgi:starch synthase